MFVVSRKQKKKEVVQRGGLFLKPGPGVWEHGWSRGLHLGERQVSAGGPAGARGPGSVIGSGPGLLCNVNPLGIRSCNRRGEVAARSLSMLTLCIPPP